METMTELTIRYNYGRGTMRINADEFLSMRSTAKIKKLLKIIRESDTPEQEEAFMVYVKQLLSGMDEKKRFHANAAVDWGTKASEREAELGTLQAELEKALAYREAYKKNSTPWKLMGEAVKEAKGKVSDAKAKVRDAEGFKRMHMREFTRAEKEEAFYEKILSEIFIQW